ncbi:MAG: glucose-6-phosphate isomerase [Methanotrichaceae archaeon]|nr:glucose-6-phosphate isomerase [Methanotrichaceae archaeon]
MELEFAGKRMTPDIRRLEDMTDVIYDRDWLKKAEDFDLYYMFRDLSLSRSDGEMLKDQGLRYDITVIPPGMLGCEYMKTAGHYHPLAPGSSVTYPEIYEVLEGEALYLLQKRDLSDVVAVYANAGDKVIVPPDYGHVTINRSNKTLKMANFVARNFSSIYEPYREMGGAAYFFTTDGWIKNPRCEMVAKLRRIEAPDAEMLKHLGMSKGREMYPLLREAGRLEYLTAPDQHMEVFESLI